MRLIVILVCGSSQFHKLGGKLLDTPTSTLRKWALKAPLRTSRELAHLVGEHGLRNPVRFSLYIAYFLAMELRGVACFEWNWSFFGGVYVPPSLVYMPFRHLGCFGVVLLKIAFRKHWPTHIVARFYGLDPHQFYRVSTNSMPPFDGLFG